MQVGMSAILLSPGVEHHVWDHPLVIEHTA